MYGETGVGEFIELNIPKKVSLNFGLKFIYNTIQEYNIMED